jgi:radical SAM protein with 4Fe4S-binding SPASM domain
MKLNIYHYWSLVKNLNSKRILNLIACYASFHISRILKKPIVWSKPVSLAVEPTTYCNLRCPECPSGLRNFTRPTGNIELDLFKKIVEELSSNAFYLTLYFQGEPFLHKSFIELIQIAKRYNLYVTTSTNAHFIDAEFAKKTVESGLDCLIISIDGLTQESYVKYRIGGQLQKVIAASYALVEAKKKLKKKNPYLIFQFIAFKHNEQEINQLFQLAKSIGIDEVKIKTAQIYDYENGSPLIPTQEKFSRYRLEKNGKYILKNKLLNQCWRMWQGCVITWDGNVVPCCFDKDARYIMGNLASDSFEKIWHSNKYTNFRTQILTSRSKIDICSNCTEGTKIFEKL